jgi:adenylate cyclase
MNSGFYNRKISAIWSADVAGYSRMMGDDEETTVHTLTLYREVLSKLIRQHRGRVIDSPGDNLLAEFASVVDAMRCAWDVQQELVKRNAELPENRRMHFRIGINLGDVIEEKGRIYGDGVNIAARLESLADPGGIKVSGTAYDQIKNKLPYRFDFTGEQQVKNIRDPVRTYKVVMGSQTPAGDIRIDAKKQKIPNFVRLLLITAGVVALAASSYYWAEMHSKSMFIKPTADISDVQMTQGASIAVLPFKNLSDDPDQEYFSDGITNDIITDLSRFHNLLVIASNTSFIFKGKTVNIKNIGQELGVRYVLEGSIQKVGDKVRINAQLIDASNETHIWAERYERNYNDIFRLQEDLVQTIVAKLAIQTFRHEQALAVRKQPQDLQAYDYLLQGWAHYQLRKRASNNSAGELFSKAISLDPKYSAAYVGLGWVNWAKVSYGWTEFPGKALENAYKNGRRALELDAANASAHGLLCVVYTLQNQYDLAIREGEQAIELNPNDALSYGQLGWVLVWDGQLDEAIAALEKSLRLDSAYPRNAWLHLGLAYYLKGQYRKALKVLEKGVVKNPDFAGYQIVLAATYARLDRRQKATQAAETLLRLDPFFKVESYGTAFRNPSHREDIVEGLRTAGLK